MKKLLVFILYDSLFKALCYTYSEPKVLDSIITQNELYTKDRKREMFNKYNQYREIKLKSFTESI